VCDLASRDSIAQCVPAALGDGGALDLLVNNAAYVPESREETAEGVEAQFAVNVLGYARVWRAALPALRRAPAPRAVFVASHYAGDLDLSDVEFKRRRYDATAAYRAAKQANRMLARALAAQAPGVRVFSCHPGIADSSVARGLGASFEKGDVAARAGAATPLFVATMPLEGTTSGTFWADKNLYNCPFIRNAPSVEALAKLVESYDAPLAKAAGVGAGAGEL
jgi:dehydrogenase/reductase SDR family protein 12